MYNAIAEITDFPQQPGVLNLLMMLMVLNVFSEKIDMRPR